MSFIERYLDRWDRRSTVRSRPRRRPAAEAAGDYYPAVRQPLASHPTVVALGPQAVAFVLVQSSYKYMNDVALTETEVVNRASLRIANGRIGASLPPAMRQIALTVVIDEAFHALVARDFIEAVEAHTGIAPLPLPDETELSCALAATRAALAPDLLDDFEVVAVCIAENTLTQEIVELSRENNLSTPFVEVLTDHLSDEAQHAGYFQKVLALHWAGLDEEKRRGLGGRLPGFLRGYLSVAVQRSFDGAVLRALGLPDVAAEAVLEDLHGGFTLSPQHPKLLNILRLLERAEILPHSPTRGAFVADGLVA